MATGTWLRLIAMNGEAVQAFILLFASGAFVRMCTIKVDFRERVQRLEAVLALTTNRSML